MIKSLKKCLSLVAAIAILALLTACAPAATTAAPTTGTIAILKDSAAMATVDVSTLAASEFKASFTKKGGIVEEHTYKATALDALLESAGATDLETGVQIIVTAKDGYAATFTLEEIQQADNIYVAGLIDGQMIEGSDGKPSAKVVVKGDDFSTRWVSDILSIDIVSG